jgi:hypothetical protein
VSVQTAAGPFGVSAGLSSENGVRTWQESCRLDGPSCTQLSLTPAVGVWSRTNPTPPGRKSLLLVAAAPGK